MTEPRIEILCGDCREIMAGMEAESVHCVITSPPYLGLRDYDIPPSVWGGDPSCHHEYSTERYYREGGNSVSSALAFSEPGPENAQRLRETRWRESTTCLKCGAWLGCLGLEPSLDLYINHMLDVFRSVRRVLHPSGTVWLNLGDAYANDGKWGGSTSGIHPKALHGAPGVGRTRQRTGLKPKDLMLLPHRVAIALQEDGWWLRSDIVWSKPNPMPESVRDRPTRSHEYVFLLTKEERYYYDPEAVREPLADDSLARVTRGRSNDHKYIDGGPGHQTIGYDLTRACNPAGRNKRSVWTIATQPYPEAHFATFPPALVEPCIRAGSSEYGCCSACGAPWRRITSTEYVNPGNRTTNGPRSLDRRHETAGFPVRLERVDTTTGWGPTCRCSTPSVRPATVLDPFAGSGTVGEVAAKHGRSAVLIELSSEYCGLIRKRLDGVQVTLPMEGTG